MRNAFFDQLVSFFRRGGAVNRSLFGVAAMDFASFLRESGTHIFEILLYVMMNFEEHFVELRRRGRLWWRGFRFFRLRRGLFFFDVNRAGVREFFYFRAATSRT